PWLFALLSCLAVIVTHGVIGWLSWNSWPGYAQLRKQFPYESMEERLPSRRYPCQDPLPDAGMDCLSDLELFVADQERRSLRIYSLEKRHVPPVRLFIGAPGFGLARLTQVSRESLPRALREPKDIPQPAFQSPADRPLAQRPPEPSAAEREA